MGTKWYALRSKARKRHSNDTRFSYQSTSPGGVYSKHSYNYTSFQRASFAWYTLRIRYERPAVSASRRRNARLAMNRISDAYESSQPISRRERMTSRAQLRPSRRSRDVQRALDWLVWLVASTAVHRVRRKGVSPDFAKTSYPVGSMFSRSLHMQQRTRCPLPTLSSSFVLFLLFPEIGYLLLFEHGTATSCLPLEYLCLFVSTLGVYRVCAPSQECVTFHVCFYVKRVCCRVNRPSCRAPYRRCPCQTHAWSTKDIKDSFEIESVSQKRIFNGFIFYSGEFY